MRCRRSKQEQSPSDWLDMIRRYNMERSDNFPVVAQIERACPGTGRLFVYTGFPVKSAMVIPIAVPDGSTICVDVTFGEKDGFYVIYEDVPDDDPIIEFSYQAQ